MLLDYTFLVANLLICVSFSTLVLMRQERVSESNVNMWSRCVIWVFNLNKTFFSFSKNFDRRMYF